MKSAPQQYLMYAFSAIGLLCAGFLGAAPGQQPVYIYLYARVSDHVNVGMSEDRLRHILPEVERYRQSYPGDHPSATILFSGAASQALEARNSQTHIVDFVKDYARRGVIEVGYDGTDEPTYDVRPTLKYPMSPSPTERWKTRQTIAGEFLAEARDPLTGAPANGTGGIKEMQEVFGKAAYIQGLELAVEAYRPGQKRKRTPEPPGTPAPGADEFGPRYGIFREIGGDTETLQMLAKYNTTAIFSGVPSANPAQLPGFRTGSKRFGELMAPLPNTAPELYWQDGVLRLSDAAAPVHDVRALDGVEALKGVLDKANRGTVQVVKVELGSTDIYLQPAFARTAPNAAVKYAYDHPQSPQLPADALRPADEVAAGYGKEDALLKWASGEFFPNNAASQFLSNAALSKMAGAADGFTVSTESLRTAVEEAFKQVGTDTRLFNFLRMDDHYLSLAELFQVLTDELAEYHQTGKLPQSVKVAKIHGPFRLVTGHGPNAGEVTAGELENLCAQIDAPLHDDTSIDVPKNSVPPLLKLDGMEINPAQLLRLMSLALANPAPETKLPVKMLYLIGEAATLVPNSRVAFDVGFVWTLKPVPLTINP